MNLRLGPLRGASSSREDCWRTRRHIPTLLLFFALVLGGCATAPVEVRNVKFAVARQESRPYIFDEGFNWDFRLDIDGFKGKRIPVRLFTGGRLVGETIATPGDANTYWEKFFVFMPLHAHYLPRTATKFHLYVVAPTDPDVYLYENTFTLKPNHFNVRQVWKIVDFQEDATLSSGKLGLKIFVNFRVIGFKGSRTQAIVGVRDLNLRDFPSEQGGPIRFDSWVLIHPDENTMWNDGVLELPYDAMKHLSANLPVAVTPGMRFPDSKVELGNSHVLMYAGGSVDRVTNLFQSELDGLEQRINYHEKEKAKLYNLELELRFLNDEVELLERRRKILPGTTPQ